MHGICDENNLKTLIRNNLRASLVPAAAEIPAQRVYVDVAVVKTFVVDIFEMVQIIRRSLTCRINWIFQGVRSFSLVGLEIKLLARRFVPYFRLDYAGLI